MLPALAKNSATEQKVTANAHDEKGGITKRKHPTAFVLSAVVTVCSVFSL